MRESLDQLAVSSEGTDAVLDDLIEVLTGKLQAGELVDLEKITQSHREYAERLRRLLPALVMMADFRNSSPRDLAGVDASGPGPGPGPGVLGDFRLIREVGRGGMGVVYEAQQLSLDRRVALKVLPMAAAMDGKQLQRFQLEAHAAACLHHTNIVPVHAVGFERGVPFYAMQFIEGRSLAQLIAELRRLEGLDMADMPHAELADISTSALAAKLASGQMVTGNSSHAEGVATQSGKRSQDEPEATKFPAKQGADATTTVRGSGSSPGSSTRSRAYVYTVAQLGVQVAEALDHAHTRGILHRDIKPANLLLDEKGQLWVTDFGLAQIQGNPGLTLTGDILGTLRYMSPEQALAKRVVIDCRTDIYSLGVTLYELLTLRPAFDGKDRQETLRRIAEDEPAPPRKLNPAVPGDLETVALKAMAKEPTGRYATARELADELRRFLDHKPILARRPSLFDRAAKWSRRHLPLVASLAVATLLFLVLAVVVLGFSNLRIEQERRRADEQKERAEANLKRAREVTDRMFTRVAQDLARIPHTEKLRRALLVDALEFYQQFLKENAGDNTLRYETALAQIKVADIHHVLGQHGRAVESWRAAIALLERLSGRFPRVPEYREELARCHGELGRGPLHGYQEGIAECLKEVEIRERLAADFPAVPVYRRKLALAHAEAGNGYGLLEMVLEAESQYRQALRHWERLRAEFPKVPEDRPGSARIHHGWGVLLLITYRLREAEQELRKAVAVREELLAEDPGNDESRSLLARTLGDAGQALLRMSKPAEAEAILLRSIRLYEDLIRDFPDTPLHARRLVVIYQYLSQVLMEMGRIDEAGSALRRAIALREKLAAEHYDHDDRPVWGGDLYQALGAQLLEAGREHEAAEAYRLACVHFERAIAEHPDIAWPKIEYADLLNNCSAIQFRNPDRAIALVREALRLTPHSREGWRMLGMAEYRAGHWAAAIEALGRWATIDPQGDPVAGFCFAIAHGRLGHSREAHDWYDRAVRWMDQHRLRGDSLRHLRAEAAAQLGLPKPLAPSGKEVPHRPKP